MDSDSGDDFAAAPPPPAAASFTTAAKLGRTKSSNKRVSAAVPVGLDVSDVRDNADDDLDAAEAAADAKKAALKTAVHYAVGQICKAEEPNLDVRVPPAAMAAIAQVVHAQLELWGRDLEAFVKYTAADPVSPHLDQTNPPLTLGTATRLPSRPTTSSSSRAATQPFSHTSPSTSTSGKPTSSLTRRQRLPRRVPLAALRRTRRANRPRARAGQGAGASRRRASVPARRWFSTMTMRTRTT
ncbi:hypothetical protein AMAG_07837 [Allomyces macrogynus ATCC 38327]|uniref:Uncharacterized protein n=1 Tax=Allomyces macrogynus (strain ATCC 38327) TaxID=578462 RepID=A0A0L0SJG8_ALLM3|nr:hypothetical protein AMAG_07837 [Allomyces macrogynus ATCC 38327]|eukprot:KNE62641.1 hypothetical protein AMAG_07837 [Allomyces macrogynus ATCC 38327]